MLERGFKQEFSGFTIRKVLRLTAAQPILLQGVAETLGHQLDELQLFHGERFRANTGIAEVEGPDHLARHPQGRADIGFQLHALVHRVAAHLFQRAHMMQRHRATLGDHCLAVGFPQREDITATNGVTAADHRRDTILAIVDLADNPNGEPQELTATAQVRLKKAGQIGLVE